MISVKNKLCFALVIIHFVIIVSIILIFSSCSSNNPSNKGKTNSKEEYYMVTFLSGIEYWKKCYMGFKDAGSKKGVKTIYTGSPQYDVNQQVTVLEQIISKNPSGIAVTCINPEVLEMPIKKAIDAGIPVVTFDADSPNSGRHAFLATDNYYAGSIAAKVLAKLIGNNGGKVVVLTLPEQLNHVERARGFKNAIKTKYNNLDIVQIINGNPDQAESAKILSGIIGSNPDIKGIFCTDATSGVGAATAVKELNMVNKIKIVSFDTDNGTLDAIKEGIISASIAQGTYLMGYESLNFLYRLKNHSDKPLPNFLDTGVTIVTNENVDKYYIN